MVTRELARGLAEGLRSGGIQRMFGMPGGGPNLDMIGEAEQVGIPFVLAHTETAACIMAASYGRVTGTPGVAVVTRGPGLASAANGLAQATLDRFPLLLISDSVTRTDAARVAHQRVDQLQATRPLTKWSGTLGTANPAELVAAAARLAVAPPAGAVYLAFDPTVRGSSPPTPMHASVSDSGAFDKARQTLAAARRPVMIVGLDAVEDAETVRAALKGLNCPIFVTYEAKGVIPESWSTYAGLFTGASLERPLLEQADLILGIGLDPVEPMPGSWSYAATTVILSRHDVETAYFGPSPALVGTYADHLPLLLDALGSEWEAGLGSRSRQHGIERLGIDTDGLDPQQVVRRARQRLDGSALTIDAGAHMLVVMPLWDTDEANAVLISNGLATMGFSLPAAIGAALARPDRRVVCMTGDGGIGMVLAELETIARLQLDITVVVFNDAALSLIELKQTRDQGGANAVHYQPIDFAATARSMGVPAATATDLDTLEDALAGVAPGPYLIDAHVDASAYSHVIKVVRG